MRGQTKLLLIPCSGEETAKLAEDIADILTRDYGMGGQVETLAGELRANVPKDAIKDRRHPLVTDFFPDIEAQVDAGEGVLEDIIRGKHVVLVEHLLTPDRKVPGHEHQTVSVNDHVMAVRGMLDLISHTSTPQRTLVAPYFTYVRSHSVEKYQKGGFHQVDTLRMTLEDYHRGGLNVIITIDVHSDKAIQTASEFGMDFHNINPFQSGRAINPAKLGLSGDNACEVMRRLRPYQERFLQLMSEFKDHLYVVSVDDGAERRTENFLERALSDLPPEEVYKRLAYFFKERVAYGNSVIGFKPFSSINSGNTDPEGAYIIPDDMFSSGKTAKDVAEILKRGGCKRVEVWTPHGVTMPQQYSKGNDRTYVDSVACLDTVPRSPALNVECIPASANLLAAEIFKAHGKLEQVRSGR